MWGVLFSALMRVVTWAFSAAGIKLLFSGILVFGIAPLIDILLSFLPDWFGISSINSASGGISSDMWYFIDYLNVSYCLSLTLAAYATRFLIRRIPFIG
jgi:hypothetical protein